MAYWALAVVCIAWGTTYLGIRIGLESFPPLLLIAVRYTISGALLSAILLCLRVELPRGRALLQTALCGVTSIGIGNGLLAIAELRVPSGLAALFYTTAPFWMVGIDAVLPHGKRPRPTTLIGLLIGFAGVVYLILPAARLEGIGGATLTGFFILQVSAAGWVTGALLQNRVRTPAKPVATAAIQQLAAGIAMFVPGSVFEKMPAHITFRSEAAVAYLVVFGSLVGFTAFMYAMARLPAALVSIYTFVNPIVAVFLGWLFFREPFGPRGAISMVVIFAGIGWVKWSEVPRSVKGNNSEVAPSMECGSTSVRSK